MDIKATPKKNQATSGDKKYVGSEHGNALSRVYHELCSDHSRLAFLFNWFPARTCMPPFDMPQHFF